MEDKRGKKRGRPRNDGLVPGSEEALKADEIKREQSRRRGKGKKRRDGLPGGSAIARKVDTLRAKGKEKEAEKLAKEYLSKLKPLPRLPSPGAPSTIPSPKNNTFSAPPAPSHDGGIGMTVFLRPDNQMDITLLLDSLVQLRNQGMRIVLQAPLVRGVEAPGDVSPTVPTLSPDMTASLAAVKRGLKNRSARKSREAV